MQAISVIMLNTVALYMSPQTTYRLRRLFYCKSHLSSILSRLLYQPQLLGEGLWSNLLNTHRYLFVSTSQNVENDVSFAAFWPFRYFAFPHQMPWDKSRAAGLQHRRGCRMAKVQARAGDQDAHLRWRAGREASSLPAHEWLWRSAGRSHLKWLRRKTRPRRPRAREG